MWSAGQRRCGSLFGRRRKMLCRKSTLSLLKAAMSYVTVNLLMGNLSHLNLNSHIVVGKLTCSNRHLGVAKTKMMFSIFCSLCVTPLLPDNTKSAAISNKQQQRGSVHWVLGISFCLQNAVTAGVTFAFTFMGHKIFGWITSILMVLKVLHPW